MKEVFVLATTVATHKMIFAVLPNPEGFAVHYSAPTERLMTADLEGIYERAQDLHARAQASGTLPWAHGRFEWPHDMLLSVVEDNFVEGRMTDEDIAQARQLHEMLEKYTPFLPKARIEVEAFLRKHFSLEDLLYVNDPVKELNRLVASAERSDPSSRSSVLEYRGYFKG